MGVHREIRALAHRVHELRLRAELEKLDRHFHRWREHRIDSFELFDAIHRFQEGPARRLLNTFNTNLLHALSTLVAAGIHDGLIRESELSEEARAHLAGYVSNPPV